MQRIPFSESELEVKGEFLNTTVAFGAAPPIYNTPITVAENLFAALKNEHLWIPTTSDIINIESRVNLDHVARAEIRDLGPVQPLEEKGGPDLFGIRWVFVPTVGGSMEDPDYPHPLQDVNDWKDIIMIPDPASWDWDASAKLNNEYLKNGKVNLFWFLNGMGFERLISFMGFEDAAVALIDEDQEDALHELLSALTDLHIKIADLAIEAYGDGLGGFCLHDDWGSQKAPFFSFEAGKEFFVPEWQRFTSHVKGKGLVCDLHSCGHVETQIENFIEGGWQSWTPMPMNDTHTLYEKYGDKMVIGIVADKWDPNASEEEQFEAGKKFAEKFCKPGKVGAYSMYTGIPVTDAFARGIYETSRKLS